MRPNHTPEATSAVLLVSADQPQCERLAACLQALRWQVHIASGGAEALDLLDTLQPATVLLDTWLPDLEVAGVASLIQQLYPHTDLLSLSGAPLTSSPAGPRRNELLHCLRELSQPSISPATSHRGPVPAPPPILPPPIVIDQHLPASFAAHAPRIEGMIGDGPAMRELRHLIALVAPHRSTVLIQGETGTGKELVAQAIHRMSPRCGKSITVLNCAAIPEALLEAELFGHTRGAFTGAVTARTGRIEAAQGGTLFLDEIGEMPLALQAKMLRFLENGELQRVGDNETLRVDVRIVAATHQDLEQRAATGAFRLDLFHRLCVFPLEVPPLRRRKEDIPALCEHLLSGLAERQRPMPRFNLTPAAVQALHAHNWPGNVRELGHVLERASILAGSSPSLSTEHIRLHRANAA